MNQQNSSSGTFPVRILIVDDHPNTATTLARAVSQLGSRVDVMSATSGREAMEKANGGAVDILITDMIMPEMNGLELVEKLQDHPGGRPTYVILITAYDVPGLKETARRLKVNEIIVKPVRPERICQIVTQALDDWSQTKPEREEKVVKKQFRILVADDRPDNVTLLARYLESEGYAHITASDGIETLEKVRAELPDLLLLDVNMPHKDGFTVLEEIRADPAVQHIPVIILTAARLDPADVQSGLMLGADDYVTKPFDRRELMARIRTKLRVKQAEDVIRRRNRELNLLPEIGKELSARMDIEELSEVLLKRTVETLGAMWGHLTIFDPAGAFKKTYRIAGAASFTSESPVLIDNLIDPIESAHQGLIIEDIQLDPRWRSMSDEPTRSAVAVPLFGRHELLGLLILSHETPRYFTLDHLLLLQAIASQAAIGVENAQLYASMARERQKFAAVLQNAGDAILMFDTEQRLNLLNPAGQKLFTDYEAKIGQMLERGHGYDNMIDLLAQAYNVKETKAGEVTWPDQRSFMALITPIEEGGHVVILHDVTHFKELEKVKNEFIATASHDLKNPIAAIAGFSQLMAQAGPLNEQQTEFIHRIQSSAQNMNQLVHDMLALVQIDLEAKGEREVIDVAGLLAEMADEFQPQARTKGQTITLESCSSQPKVRGDRGQLRQMLRNLIGNAIKYTPEGGTVTLSLSNGGGVAVVEVRDTGYGIPMDDLPFIFNRFYRVRHESVSDIDGNGLGLAIVKSVAEQHGGQVSVQSDLGKGSCFTVSLPVVSRESNESENQTLEPVAGGAH